MKSIKVLIWNTYLLEARRGGPSTYLYNLRESAKKNHIEEIYFADDFDSKKTSILNHSFFKKKIKPKIIQLLDILYSSRKKPEKQVNKLLAKKTQANFLSKLDIQSFTHIHFHSTLEFYKNQDLLKNYKGKILLTSHSPKPLFLEYIEDHLRGILFEETHKKQVEEIDRFAFETADYVIYPCEEAQEPYTNRWNNYKKLNFKNPVVEFPTCAPKSIIKSSRQEIRTLYNIPENSFVISYFGRHNEVKGYDLLKELGETILGSDMDIYFLIAGKEIPLSGLKNKRWIEVGWTNDPHSLTNASDLFILPNRETYFDLALLEVLSIGTPVLISDTGGNKYFKKFEDNLAQNIHYFDSNNAHSLTKEVEKLYQKRENLTSSTKLFDNYFNSQDFAKKYIDLIKSLG